MNQLLKKYMAPTTNEGRTESMSQLLKKCALLAVCVALALCFTTRSAHAQADPTVNMSGVGEHLIFGYWSTADYMNTNVNIHSPLGVRTSGETKNVVRVVIRNGMGMAAANFKICLTPGDSWTATLSMDGLMVADAGNCDDAVQQMAPDRNNVPNQTPAMGEMLSLGDAESGYLEAWLAPNKGLVDDTVPCEATADPATPAMVCASEAGAGGGDADLVADNATPRHITGTAMLVSAMSGFSSSYNATALNMCGNKAAAADAAVAINANADDGNGCWHQVFDTTAARNTDVAGTPIKAALDDTGNMLTGRWTAISDENVMSHTKVVLTLPMNHLNYAGKMGAHAADADASIIGSIAEVEGTDPVSMFVFDDTGGLALSAHDVMLGMNVNMCMFMASGMDMMDMPMLACNDEMVGALDGMSGEFRIFNNVMDNVALPDATTAGQYNLTGAFSDGTELTGIGAHNAAGALVDSDPDTAGDQIPQMPAENLAAIGLVFSYFEGTDGSVYDQVTPVKAIMGAAANL